MKRQLLLLILSQVLLLARLATALVVYPSYVPTDALPVDIAADGKQWPPGLAADPSGASVVLFMNRTFGGDRRPAGPLAMLIKGNESAMLDFDVPWSIRSNTSEWVPPTSIRYNPFRASQMEPNMPAAFRAVNGGPLRTQAGRVIPVPLNASNSDAAAMQGRVVAIDAQGGSVLHLRVVAAHKDESRMVPEKLDSVSAPPAPNASIDWATVSGCKVVGQFDMDSAFVLDKSGELFAISSNGTVSRVPVLGVGVAGLTPSGRMHGSLVPINHDQLMLSGGFDGSKVLDDMWIFDLRTSAWYLLPRVMALPRMHHQSTAIAVFDPADLSLQSSTHLVIVGGTLSNVTLPGSSFSTLPMEVVPIAPTLAPHTILTSAKYPQFPNSPTSQPIPFTIQPDFSMDRHLVILSQGNSTNAAPAFWLAKIGVADANSTVVDWLKPITYFFPRNMFRDRFFSDIVPGRPGDDQGPSAGEIAMRFLGWVVIVAVLVTGTMYAHKKTVKRKGPTGEAAGETVGDVGDVEQQQGADAQAPTSQSGVVIAEEVTGAVGAGAVDAAAVDARAVDAGAVDEAERGQSRLPGGAVVEIEVDTSYRAD